MTTTDEPWLYEREYEIVCANCGHVERIEAPSAGWAEQRLRLYHDWRKHAALWGIVCPDCSLPPEPPPDPDDDLDAE